MWFHRNKNQALYAVDTSAKRCRALENVVPMGGQGDKSREQESVDLDVETLYRSYYKVLLRFLRSRLQDHEMEVARDIAQEAFCRVERYLGERRELEYPRSLLFQIGKNLLIDYRRSGYIKHGERNEIFDEELLPSLQPDQEQILEGQRQLQQLSEAIQSLPPRCQEVFVLSRLEEMEYKDIAVRCGITVSMVEKHISKAMKIVRRHMQTFKQQGS